MPMPVYMDYNATAPMRPEAIEAMLSASNTVGNPSSVHRFGRLARRMVEDARDKVAAMAGATAAQVVFTGSGTEANNLAILGSGRPRLLASAIEHDSVLKARGAETVPVDRQGRLDLAALETSLRRDARPALVAVMLANNETGVIQPVAEAARIAHAHGALLLCDAVQAAGRLPIDMQALGADLLSLSAHKLGGPKGAGALIVADQVPLSALLTGGGQERGRRAGTENLAGIAGFGAAAALADRGIADQPRLARLRDRLEAGLARLGGDIAVLGRDAARLANTSAIALPGLAAERLVIALDLAGLAVSAGAACSSGKLRPSTVATAMGLDPATAAAAIRVSLGWQTADADIDRFLEAWTPLALKRAHADMKAEPAA
jgi:cysteine desulfurase